MQVIEFIDDNGTIMAKRLPDNGLLEILWGSQLTVRENQEAVFFRDGKALDVFSAGRHILKTQNVPVVGKWVTSFGYGENSPFRAEIVFIGKQLFANLKWGTREPILFRDTELQAVRLRSFGSYSIQVTDSMLFINKVVGTKGFFTTNLLEDYLKGIIISKLNVVIAKELKSVFDIAKSVDQLNLVLRIELQNDFSGLGLKIHDFYIQSISIPEEVQKMIDTKSGIGALGNLDLYMKYKVANAIGDSAINSGGSGDAFNAGVGLSLGMILPQVINSSFGYQNNVSFNSIEKLKKLKELLELGAITKEEFEEKKTVLLNEI
ncbi:MAG: SPFH domain-containing protein [Flavipsychrobacter sp.]|nr:SPFH domain-containing protein [Flavipsychrobacter sp.]